MTTVPLSTLPAVKGYLFDALAARTEITSTKVLVSYDDPGPYMPDDIIAVLDADRNVSTLAMVGDGGAGWLAEEYVLAIVVSCYRGGDTARVVFERACALADVVVDVVRQDPSCGQRVYQAKPSSINYESEWNTQETEDGTVTHLGRMTTVTVGVTVSAQI